MKKIAIIGGGVAGLTAAVYALRANAEVTMFEQFGLGGLTATIDKIENFPSYNSIDGWQLAQNIVSQAKSLGLNVVRKKVISLSKLDNLFEITTTDQKYQFVSVIVATGTAHNKLGIESSWIGKGVSYCATCDGNFYRNKTVAVVGGGNHAVKEAFYLKDICKNVVVICPQDKLSGDALVVEKLLLSNNVKVIFNSVVQEIVGDDFVNGLISFDGVSTQKIDVDGIFVAIGAVPVTDFIHIEELKTNKGYIVVDSRCESTVEGLFAAGDVADGSLKQIVTACGDGAKAGAFSSAYCSKKN